MDKKGASYMWWVIIGAVICIMFFAVYAFAINKGVGNSLKAIFRIQDDTNDRAACSVWPWTNGDNDGDGIRDDLPECARFKESSSQQSTETTQLTDATTSTAQPTTQ